jgi:hypothetical protein
MPTTSPHDEDEAIRLGKEAFARKAQDWNDWYLIGEACAAGQRRAMREAGTNQPYGRNYTKRFSAFLADNPEFGDGPNGIGKVTRSHLMKCIDLRIEIEAWRQFLPCSPASRLEPSHHGVAPFHDDQETQGGNR